MDRLLEIMRTLRGPEGCPWDKEQTHNSLRPYLLEEAAEAVDAITRGDEADMIGELGDVLLQVAFHTIIGEEENHFGYSDVEEVICDKLIRRHPHVFGDTKIQNTEELKVLWEEIKLEERGGKAISPLERIPAGLGALERERQTQDILEHPLPSKTELLQIIGEISEDAQGYLELVEAVVAYGRNLDLNPELLLRAYTNQKIQEGA